MYSGERGDRLRKCSNAELSAATKVLSEEKALEISSSYFSFSCRGARVATHHGRARTQTHRGGRSARSTGSCGAQAPPPARPPAPAPAPALPAAPAPPICAPAAAAAPTRRAPSAAPGPSPAPCPSPSSGPPWSGQQDEAEAGTQPDRWAAGMDECSEQAQRRPALTYMRTAPCRPGLCSATNTCACSPLTCRSRSSPPSTRRNSAYMRERSACLAQRGRGGEGAGARVSAPRGQPTLRKSLLIGGLFNVQHARCQAPPRALNDRGCSSGPPAPAATAAPDRSLVLLHQRHQPAVLHVY